MKKYLLLFLLFISAEILAQTKIPVDTLKSYDKFIKIVLYSDKTWDSISMPKPKHYDSELYYTKWKTDEHNAYKDVQITDLPDTITLTLVEDSSDFSMPCIGYVISKYGWRHGRIHAGSDIPQHIGDPIHTAFEGRVRFTGYCGGYGNLVVVRHWNGLETYYGHLSKICVETGEFVNVGEVIGLAGSTGRSTGPHLHFETRYMGFPFDPETLVVWNDNKLRCDTLTLPRTKLNSSSRYSESSASSSSSTIITGDGTWHTIKQGDTLGAIARRYGTTVSKICSLNNNLTPTTILKLGRKIRVK